ncbi:MAG: Coenzyme F420 hydrogenase/dehydrogenase, beta subunit C-terminal domain [Candidatus Cloacimonetes bacterium]|nr:Coenzyme F420 hydrogenase/dehydrogenase, beta subunit C-terminal domain [Candidatus Cloacimonadota bacterium]MCF8315153.1 Coenzyme F420 hydrogenase/dehydrogenase, beta subunit C-terminal domain [Ignavibacteriales bacterium]MCF8435851.1 Coenzyme F420 hydrogenase/dehydrogenase, beta subunit C-terminal domain [Ignavibacteriales bacterium]
MEIKKNELYVGFSNDDSIRNEASSGGIVTALLTYLLRNRIVDGVIVSRIESENGVIKAVSKIISDFEEIKHYAGSSYVDTPVLSTVKNIIAFKGKVAIVALPCQMKSYHEILSKNDKLKSKIILTISLFCRGNVTSKFYDDYFKKTHINTDNIERIKIKRGYIKGQVEIKRYNKEVEKVNFSDMNFYRISGVHSKRLCLSCTEHLGVNADISVGDIFTSQFKNHPIKHSAIIPRSGIALEILTNMINDAEITLKYFGADNYNKYFKKNIHFDSNLTSRKYAAKILGINLGNTAWKPDTLNLFHVCAWLIYFANYRLSKNKNGNKFIYSLPKIYFRIAAYLIKFLSKL